ncbi:cupin domain-containing protein [Patescibacteria group bacterium]
MKLLNSTPIARGISYSAGYSNGCSVVIVHAKPETGSRGKLHYHTKDSEYFYVLHGELILEVEGKKIKVKKGECLETEPGEKHKVTSFEKNTEYIVVRTNLLPGEKVILG